MGFCFFSLTHIDFPLSLSTVFELLMPAWIDAGFIFNVKAKTNLVGR